jgi:hypothetical protein
MPGVDGGMLGALACVAATSRGFTPWAPGWWRGVWFPAAGVVVPVAMGVDILEGISEVNMPADGDRMYFCVIVESKAGTKPVLCQ